MHVSLADLARHVQGRLTGDPAQIVRGAAPLIEATAEDISFLDQAANARQLQTSQAGALIVPLDFSHPTLPVIAVDDVHAAFAAVLCLFRPPRQTGRIGVSPQAFVSPSAQLGVDVDIHPGAYIGDAVTIGDGCTIHSGARIMAGCRIGRQTTIFPGAVLYEECVVGDRCLIHANAILGSHGFGYKCVEGRHRLGPQFGNVVIENDVDVGAGAAIDRGSYGSTLIGEGTKIDNLVQIGHNCRIGRHNILCAHVGIAGSCRTGDYVVMGGKVGVADHVTIGEQARVGAMTGVPNDLAGHESYLGLPATQAREQALLLALVHKLPEFKRALKKMEQAVRELQEARPRSDAA